MSTQPSRLAVVTTPLPHAPAVASDDALVARVAAGDLDSLGKLFDRHAEGVRHFLARLGISAGDIDDVTQLTFLDVLAVAPKFSARSSVRSWILGIAAMGARRHRRSVARTFASIASAMFERGRAAPCTPGESYDAAETNRRFEAALARLPIAKREVFVMVTIEGASGEEVAQALDIPVATVWTRLHHARKALRAEIFPEEAQP